MWLAAVRSLLLYPVTPILAILGCLWIIKDLRIPTLLVFMIWTAVVLAWYFAYGRKHSTAVGTSMSG